MADIIVDTLKAHQSKAGKKGGRSKSPAKIAAARANLAKVRHRRHNPVTGPQPIQPASPSQSSQPTGHSHAPSSKIPS